MAVGTAQIILTALQLLNGVVRLLDPTGRNPAIRSVLARHVNGELDEGEANQALLTAMRERGDQVMDRWTGQGPAT
jgi:hypothetical protein